MTDNADTDADADDDADTGNDAGYETPVTSEDIEEWEEEHDEPHPVFEVEHRPERTPLTQGCLWGDCDNDDAVRVRVITSDDEIDKTRVCDDHRDELEKRTGVAVEILAPE